MHNLTSYSAKDCFFKAAVLYLAVDDVIGNGNALSNYVNRDPRFESSREYKFVMEIADSMRNSD